MHQLSNCIDAVAGKKNEKSLNPIAEPFMCIDDLKEFEIEEKRFIKEDAHNNKNKEQDWQTMMKNRTKGKGNKNFQ